MKKELKLLAIAFNMLFFINHNAFTQATQAGIGALGHNPGANPPTTHYLGWDATTTIPLQIRHDAALPITFHTNGTQRMYITQNNAKQKTVK